MRGDLQRRLEDLERRTGRRALVIVFFNSHDGETLEDGLRRWETQYGETLEVGREIHALDIFEVERGGSEYQLKRIIEERTEPRTMEERYEAVRQYLRRHADINNAPGQFDQRYAVIVVDDAAGETKEEAMRRFESEYGSLNGRKQSFHYVRERAESPAVREANRTKIKEMIR